MSNHTPGSVYFDLLYTGGTFTTADNTAIKDISLVIFDLVLLQFALFYMTLKVSRARKKYGVDYPNLYAVAGSNHVHKHGALVKEMSQEDADSYNAVQRAHQNAVESLPQAIGLMIVGSFGFPAVTGILGLLWIIGRIVYAAGYAIRPKARILGGVIAGISLWSLVFLNFALFVYIAQGKAPISFGSN